MTSTEYETVTPTPTVDELEEGDFITYTAKPRDESRWSLHEDEPVSDVGLWQRSLREWYDYRILEVQRPVKPKREYYPRFVPLRGRPGTGGYWSFEWPDGGLDSFRDLGVEYAAPVVAVPKKEWDELVKTINNAPSPGAAWTVGYVLVKAWKEVTGND